MLATRKSENRGKGNGIGWEAVMGRSNSTGSDFGLTKGRSKSKEEGTPEKRGYSLGPWVWDGKVRKKRKGKRAQNILKNGGKTVYSGGVE